MVFSKVGPNQSIEWGQFRVSKSHVLANRLAVPAGQLADGLDTHSLPLQFFCSFSSCTSFPLNKFRNLLRMEWSPVYHVKGWGKFNRHYGDFCTGADNFVTSAAKSYSGVALEAAQ
jgi:hypothetical protein